MKPIPKSFRNVLWTFTRGHNRNLPTRISKTSHILDNVSKEKLFVMAFFCDLFNYINACRTAPEKVRLTAKYYLPFLPACDCDCDCNCDCDYDYECDCDCDFLLACLPNLWSIEKRLKYIYVQEKNIYDNILFPHMDGAIHFLSRT